MRKLFVIVITALALLDIYALYAWHNNATEKALGAFSDPFLSIQLATSPVNGNCLTTDGTNNAWGSCGAGSSTFSWTPQTWGNSTSTPIGFLNASNGIIVTASSTFSYLASGLVGNNSGRLYSFASSSLFGYTPLNPTRNITVAGTANQITSSAGAQDLSADRTWTLSLPSHVIFPGTFQATQSTTTNATTTSFAVTGTATTTFAGPISLGTGNHIVAHGIEGDGSDGLHIDSSASGPVVANFGAGGGTGATFYGGVNIDGTTRLATALNGVLKATSGTVSAAANGTDYTLITANTCGAGNHFSAVTAAGAFTCSADTGGGAFSWTPATNFGVNTNSTTTPIWFKGSPISLMASSTAVFDNASTTQLTVSNKIYNGDIIGTPDAYIENQSGSSYVWIQNSNGTVALQGYNGVNTATLDLKGDILFTSDSAIRFNNTAAGTYIFNSPNFDGTLDWSALTTARTLKAPNLTGVFALGSYSTGFTNGDILIGSSGLIGTTTALRFDGYSLLATHATTTYASSTAISTANLNVSGTTVLGAGTGLLLTTSGTVSNYAGTSCTNQFVRSVSASGVATCATVASTDVSLANLSATDSTLTFSGTYNGSTARTIGLNLGNANTWTALQTFNIGAGLPGIVTNSLVGIGTTTPKWALTIASSTGPGLALTDGSNTSNIFTFRSIANSFFIATASPSTFATTTYSVFSISPGGQVSLSALQPATSTAITLDWSATPNQVEYRIGGAATTITLINATTSAFWGSTKRVWVCNPGGTAGALTWAGVEWIGTAPTQTTTANQCDLYFLNITRATSTSAYKVAGGANTGYQ